MNNTLHTVMTIAGSDSGGGAGIQADLRTFNAFGVYGCSAITAVTAQNPFEVRNVDILSAESVAKQLESILDVFPGRFAKTGMLADSKIVECVAEFVGKYNLQLIVDPVMVSTSGAKLLQDSAISVMLEKLFPLAVWITPNIPEAELICGRKLKTHTDLADAALSLFEKYKCNVILKGGHASDSDKASDIVCCQGNLYELSSPAVNVRSNTAHGTGCTLSAAMAANFALNKSWEHSLIEAKAFVYGSLYESRILTDNLSQMYPPTENYSNQITLEKL